MADLEIDWARAVCAVKPPPAGRPPRWSGGAANVLLGRVLAHELGGEHASLNHSITLKGDAATSVVRVKEALAS